MKKICLLTVFFALFLSEVTYTQVLFEKRYGANSDNFVQAAGAVTAPDGGLILSGYTELAQDYEIFIQKLNSDGAEVWRKTYNNVGMDAASGLVAAAGGGYLLAGFSLNSVQGSFDALLLKVDENGDLLWRKTFGGLATDLALALCQLNNGNIVLQGYTMLSDNSPAHFRAVFDASGNLVSSTNYSLTDDIGEILTVPTTDGGYLSIIQTGSFFTTNAVQIIKYNSGLNIQWSTPITTFNLLTGSTITNVFDLKSTSNGVLLCVETGIGIHLLHLANVNGAPLWIKPVYTGFAFGAGAHIYPDETIGLFVNTAPSFYKKLSASGTTIDSVGVPFLQLLSNYESRYVFNSNQEIYIFSNNSSGTYAVEQVGTSSTLALNWSKTFSDLVAEEDETGDVIASTADGGFVMVGIKERISGDDSDVWVLRADAQGSVLWEKIFVIDSGFFYNPRVGSVKLDVAGNIIILAASSSSDPAYHLLKLSSDGILQFNKVIATSDYDAEFYRAYPLPAGGFISCITLYDYDPKPILVRVNNDGDVLWTKEFDGTVVNDLVVLPDGDFICAGAKDEEAWIFKVNSVGNLVWEQTYSINAYANLFSITMTSDGSLGVVGAAGNAAETSISAVVLKANVADGALIWQKQFDKGANSLWIGGQALPAPMGGVCFMGIYLEPPANEDLFSFIFRYRISLSAVDASGNLISDAQFGNDATHPVGQHADCTPDGNVIFCATTDYGLTTQDAWVVKAAAKTVGTAVAQQTTVGRLNIQPNPAIKQTRLLLESPDTGPVQVQVFDAQGKEMTSISSEKSAKIWSLDLPLLNWPVGVYQVVIRTEQGRRTQKLVVVR